MTGGTDKNNLSSIKGGMNKKLEEIQKAEDAIQQLSNTIAMYNKELKRHGVGWLQRHQLVKELQAMLLGKNK